MWQALIHALHDPDPTRRIQMLQVVAMLEETRAIQTVHDLFKSDPDPQVRQTAKWAGSLLWQAQQRGYSTDSAVEAHFARQKQVTSDRQEAVVDSVLLHAGNDHALNSYLSAARTQWEVVNEVRQRDPRATQTQSAPLVVDHDHLDLLEAGLSRAVLEDDEIDAGLSELFRSKS